MMIHAKIHCHPEDVAVVVKTLRNAAGTIAGPIDVTTPTESRRRQGWTDTIVIDAVLDEGVADALIRCAKHGLDVSLD